MNAWWKLANPKIQKISRTSYSYIGTATDTAKQWILNWFLLASHNPPNVNNPKASVPKIFPRSLYEQYVCWCQRSRDDPIIEDGFRGCVYVVKSDIDVVTRQSKKGSTECAVCSVLKRAESNAISFTAKTNIRKLQTLEQEFHNTEVSFYIQQIAAAKDDPDNIQSITMDGADQSSHDIPKVKGRTPKDLSAWPQKIQGVLVHGQMLSFYCLPVFVRGGANMACTTLLRTYQLMKKGPPPLNYLKVDGTISLLCKMLT